MNLLTSISNPIKYNSEQSLPVLPTPLIYYTCINEDIDTANSKIKNYATGNYDLTYNNASFISTQTNPNFNSSLRGSFYSNNSIFASGTLASGYSIDPSLGLTISMWIKINNLSAPKGRNSFNFGGTSNNTKLRLDLDFNQSGGDFWSPFFYINDQGIGTGSGFGNYGIAKINNWSHYVLTYNSSQIKIFINGVHSFSGGSYSRPSFITPSTFEIAGKPTSGANRMDAFINEFRIYNTELTQTQINALYNWNGSGTL